MNFGGPEMIIVLVVVLVLFGGSQLPKLAKNLGKAQQEFKAGLSEGGKDGKDGKDGAVNAKSAEAPANTDANRSTPIE
jgi:sec-independent protein translocase protein TatA